MREAERRRQVTTSLDPVRDRVSLRGGGLTEHFTSDNPYRQSYRVTGTTGAGTSAGQQYLLPPPLTSPPPLPQSQSRIQSASQPSHVLYTERRFGTGYGLTAGSGVAFYRSGPAVRHIETLPRIQRNPAASDLIAVRRQLNHSGRKLDETANAVASDLLYRYGCQAMTSGSGCSTTGRLERTSSGRGSYRSAQNSAQLCRCDSGGPLPQSGSPTPLPPVSFAPTTSFRGVQSLPSTPNAARRPVDLPPNRSLIYSADQQPQPQLQQQPQSQQQPGQVSQQPNTRLPAALFPDLPTDLSARPEQFILHDDPGQVSDSALLAGDVSRAGGLFTSRLRSLHPFGPNATAGFASHRPPHSSSQPLTTKISSLIIILIALIIVGFIVFSPLLHYSIDKK